MNIAIDGRALNTKAGIGVYTRSVLLALQDFPEHRYTVYGYSPVEGEDWPSNWSFKSLNSRRERVGVFHRLQEDVLFSPSSYLTTIASNRPVLMTVHDLVIYRVPVKLPFKTVLAEKYLLKKALRRSMAITVQTESVKADLVEFFPFTKPKIRVVRPGIAASVSRAILPPKDEQEKVLQGLGIKGSYILFVGTLEPRKNLVRLIKAYEGLSQELKTQYQLVLAGKLGWADQALKATLENLPSGVVMTGRVEDSTLASLYNNAELIAYPSLYEGVGYPVLEGFYWNKPVLTSNVSSMKEIGQNAAELVNPNSEDSIQNGLRKILSDDELQKQLVKAGEQELSKYSWKDTAKAYLAILQEIS